MLAEASLFDRVIDIISHSTHSEDLTTLRASEAEEQRYHELCKLDAAGVISREDQRELYRFETVNHLVRMANLRALVRKKEAQ